MGKSHCAVDKPENLSREIFLQYEHTKIMALGGKFFEILRDYLSDCRQYISHNDVCTEKPKIVSGVPQGSVLGPFRFLLHNNDIHLCIGNCTMAIFADDTTILSSKRKGLCSIQSDMDNFSQWFCQNRLSINRDKCEAVAFGRGHLSEILILDKKFLIRTRANI